MKKYGLIGFPLGHSFSQTYFTEKFRRENITGCIYELYPLENIDDVRLLFEINKELFGLNVTIPYKESIIPFLDELDPTAQQIGAVNCIRIEKNNFNTKKGFNTDFAGFRDSLFPLLKKHHKNALILGTGGAAKSIAFALEQMGIEYKFVSRKKNNFNITYSELNKELIEASPLIINCTPLGMSPNSHVAPEIPYAYLTSKHICFDLVYNPAETLFLSLSAGQNAVIKNGQEMLELQAEYAWKIWNE